ncbi:WSC domain-containing protein [Mycena olivaceomarginata]|nr:WSC domain-containing protein [Mycena olivaceomarginata]
MLICKQDTGAVFSPIGVAANPNFAAVACTTSAATSFLPSSTSASITSTPTSSSASSVSSTPTTSIASGWSTAIPCATDTPSRILTNTYITNSNTNTPLSCTQNCFSLGFTYAAVEYGDECYCGADLVSDVAAAPISDCNVPCAGDATITCGAGWRMQVRPSAVSVSVVYNTTLTPPANVAPSGWKPYGTTGCSQDSGSRVFANSVSASGIASTNSPAACMSYCANQNYTMSGVENGSECYCGSAWTDDTPASDIPKASCGQACPGAPGTTCGGSWAIQIYVATSS